MRVPTRRERTNNPNSKSLERAERKLDRKYRKIQRSNDKALNRMARNRENQLEKLTGSRTPAIWNGEKSSSLLSRRAQPPTFKIAKPVEVKRVTIQQTNKFREEDGTIDFESARHALKQSDRHQAAASALLIAIGAALTPITDPSKTGLLAAGALAATAAIDNYKTNRDLPTSRNGTSMLGLSMIAGPSMVLGSDLIAKSLTDLQGSAGAASAFAVGSMFAITGLATPFHQWGLHSGVNDAERHQDYVHKLQAEHAPPTEQL